MRLAIALPVAGALLVTALALGGQFGAAVAMSMLVAILTLVAVAERRHVVRVLRYGVPAVAVVTWVGTFKGGLIVRCRYTTTFGPIETAVPVNRRRAERELGGWPEPGDTLYVVHPPNAILSPILWGFGADTGRLRDAVGPARWAAVRLIAVGATGTVCGLGLLLLPPTERRVGADGGVAQWAVPGVLALAGSILLAVGLVRWWRVQGKTGPTALLDRRSP